MASSGQIITADEIADDTITAAQIATDTITATELASGAVTTTEILDGTILNADIDAAAAIAVSKLAAGGIANRVVATANGTTVAMQQIVTNMIANASVGTAQLAESAVTSNEIADDTITNADISTIAAIALAKLAHVGAGNVLRSNGTTNVAGQVVTGDIAPATILTADIANEQITDAKLANPCILTEKLFDSAVTAAKIFDGNVTTAKLAANAVTQSGFFSASDSLSTNSASFVAIGSPTFSVTLTTTGGDILLWMHGLTAHDTLGGRMEFGLRLDTAAETTVAIVYGQSSTGSTPFGAAYRMTGVSAASHTFEVRWRNLDNGGGSANQFIDYRQLLVVELKR